MEMQRIQAKQHGWDKNRIPELGHKSLLWAVGEIGEVDLIPINYTQIRSKRRQMIVKTIVVIVNVQSLYPVTHSSQNVCGSLTAYKSAVTDINASNKAITFHHINIFIEFQRS